jgi:phage replication O-like protein O
VSSPQLEGYIRITNELFDALVRTRLSGEERQIFDCILRKTFGFNKPTDAIPLSQFEAATGLDRGNICRSIKKLKKKRFISVKSDTGKTTTYGINKIYSQWSPVSKVTRVNMAGVNIDNLPVSILTHSKDISSKDNKDSLSSDFFSLWNATVEGKLPTARSLSAVRKRKIKTRLEEKPLSDWKTVFEKMTASPFCRGENARGWKPDIDWIIDNDNNAVKVLEGKYDSRPITPAQLAVDLGTSTLTAKQIQEVTERRYATL